jgi:dienelactone hydrolase
MRYCSVLFLCVLLFYNSCCVADTNTHQNKSVEQSVIVNPEKPENKIEFFMLKPSGEGPFPAVFLLHGFQSPENSLGGKQLLEYRYLERFAKEGVVAVAISIPGYGNSTGKRDFGGPDSQKAIIAVINHFKTLPFVDSARMGIYGISRGAQLAGMVSSRCPDISIQILEGGFYDVVSFGSEIPEYLEGIKRSIAEEGAHTREALVERSPVYHADSVMAATMILQGEFDDRRQLPAARALHAKLIKCGKESKLKVYLGEMHALPDDKWDTIIPFVRQHFFNIYGIGIKVSEATPAIQILKIHPDSPAQQSGKLKVGDAILSISPMNDDVEINTLRMPLHKFVSLLLGKKGDFVRLRVQHFDLSIEDLIIQRG